MKRLISLSLMAALLPAAFFIFTGCMKKPETTRDYGPEASLDDIQKAISDDAPMDLNKLKAGQYVSIDETQVVNTQIPATIAQRVDEITGFADLPTYVSLDFKVTWRDYVNGAWKESTQPFTLAIGKGADVAATSSSKSLQTLTTSRSAAQVSIQSLQKMDAAAPLKVTYHNLKREIGRVPVPEIVKSHPNCGGVENCAAGLRYLQVSFDRVIWESEDNGTKTTFKITYSQDIPPYIHDWDDTSTLYFTNQLQTCAQTWLTVSDGDQSQIVPVLQCLDVRDFKFGI